MPNTKIFYLRFTDRLYKDAYNRITMNDQYLQALISVQKLKTADQLSEKWTQPQATAVSTDFQSLMVSMMSGSGMTDLTGDTSSLSGGSLISSALFSLIEQVLARQMQALQASSAGAAQADTTEKAVVGKQAVESSHSTPSGAPVHGVLTQNFHTGHNGLDFGIAVGTGVHSSMDGKVIYAGWNNQGYGNLVIVENGPYRTYYAHLSKIPVKIGQTVQAGEVVGLSGNTGNSTGPHLHYEVRLNNKPINPAKFTL
jgi:murein DD-endopeptidase MepM/ murein hydrolase activator NlpD